jgi:hypothetical protein
VEKVEKVKTVSDIVRSWLPWVILVIISLLAYQHIKSLRDRPVRTVTVTDRVEVPVPGPIRWRDRIVWRDVDPDTIVIDTVMIRIDTVLYHRPWALLSIDKKGSELSAVAFRPGEDDPNEGHLRRYAWGLRTGKTWKIYPTRNPKDPFKLREDMDLLCWRWSCGYSATDKVYIGTGIYYKAARIGKIVGDVGLVSFVSFSRQDISVEFVLR